LQPKSGPAIISTRLTCAPSGSTRSRQRLPLPQPLRPAHLPQPLSPARTIRWLRPVDRSLSPVLRPQAQTLATVDRLQPPGQP